MAVSRKAGGRAEGLSAALTSVGAGISKSGASLFATDLLTVCAKALSGRCHEP